MDENIRSVPYWSEMRRGPARKRSWDDIALLVVMFVTVAAGVVMAWVYTFHGKSVHRPPLHPGVILVVIGVVVFCLYVEFVGPTRRGRLGSGELSISPDGITISSKIAKSTRTIGWRTVDEIIDVDSRIELRMTGGLGLVVERNSFVQPAQADSFLSKAREFHTAQLSRPATAKPPADLSDAVFTVTFEPTISDISTVSGQKVPLFLAVYSKLHAAQAAAYSFFKGPIAGPSGLVAAITVSLLPAGVSVDSREYHVDVEWNRFDKVTVDDRIIKLIGESTPLTFVPTRAFSDAGQRDYFIAVATAFIAAAKAGVEPSLPPAPEPATWPRAPRLP
ncbi:MAG: hypothetical protein ACLQVD_19400 [Capsulimonadaceae bacterium]